MTNFDGINHYATSQSTSLPGAPKRRKRRAWKWVLAMLLLILGSAAFFGSSILSKTSQIFTNKQNIFVRVGRLLVSDDKPLLGEEAGVINVLLLGHGGPGHEGPNLTDTMIVASFHVSSKEVTLTSIPRDFMVRLPERGFNKINAAYAYAELDEPGRGGEAAVAAAEEVTGLDIHYFAAVDFQGFVKAVDRVGGLDIEVERAFTDSQYPDYNYGYLPPVTFTKGPEHMDGERALIFARSRKGTNGEGTDFARSERQKKIMVAFKEKLLGLNVSDLGTLNGLLSDFSENFRTNLEPHELKRLAALGRDVSGDNVFSVSLEPDAINICQAMVDLATGRTPPKPVAEEPAAGAEQTDGEEAQAAAQPQVQLIYVVIPCSGKTLADIHEYLDLSLTVARLQNEGAAVEIQNTTGSSAVLAPWRRLSETGLDVEFSTSRSPVERTILYDNTQGGKPKTKQYLTSRFNPAVSDLPYTQSSADFVIILGRDSL